MSVAVIGGGVAGLLSAINIRNLSADVFESLPRLGMRKHCTGVVSLVTTHECLGRDFIDNYFRYLIIRLGNLRVKLWSESPFACRLSREGHEVFLSEEVVNLGHKVLPKHKVLEVREVGNGYELIVKCPDSIVRRFRYDYVVITEGYPSRLSKSLGFNAVTNYLVGAQYRVVLDKGLSEYLSESLIVNYCVDPTCGFTWYVPLSRRELLIGLASTYYVGRELINVLNKLLKTVGKALRTDLRKVELFGGYVLRGYPREFVVGKAVALGDTNSTVKSVSGGGLYPITKTVNEVIKNLDRGRLSSELGKVLRRQLRTQYLISKSLIKLRNQLSKLRASLEAKITPREYDRHEELLIKLLRGEVSIGLLS